MLFAAFVLALAKDMPVNALARFVGEHDTRIWRVLRYYVETARTEGEFSGLSRVGVDETSSTREHNYSSAFVDLDERRLLFATEGRDARALGAFRVDLDAHDGAAKGVRDFLDMSPACLKGARERFPLAEITFDKFHVVKLLNEAGDQVRHAEQGATGAQADTLPVAQESKEATS